MTIFGFQAYHNVIYDNIDGLTVSINGFFFFFTISITGFLGPDFWVLIYCLCGFQVYHIMVFLLSTLKTSMTKLAYCLQYDRVLSGFLIRCLKICSRWLLKTI